MLTIILDCRVELLFFTKRQPCTGSVLLTTVALFCHRPRYWCQGGERGGGQVWAPREGENGLTSSLRAQGSHSSKPPPPPPPHGRGRDLTGLRSNFWSIPLNCPDPFRQYSIQSPSAHLQEENAADPNAKMHCYGSPLSGFSAYTP